MRGEEVYSDISSSTCHSSPLLPSTQQQTSPPQAPLPWGSPALYSKSQIGTLGGYAKPTGSIGKMNNAGGIYNGKSTTASYSKSTGGWGGRGTFGANGSL